MYVPHFPFAARAFRLRLSHPTLKSLTFPLDSKHLLRPNLRSTTDNMADDSHAYESFEHDEYDTFEDFQRRGEALEMIASTGESLLRHAQYVCTPSYVDCG